jgi:alpha-tubulin suppressor-like RCC1 family protein
MDPNVIKLAMGAAGAGGADNRLYGWGRNVYGEIGLGNTTSYSSPKQVGALTTWSQIAMGSGHSLAISESGALWAWGNGGSGKLGLGNTTSYSSPKQVGSLTNWATLMKCGGTPNFSAAIKTDGTLWMWGNNSEGQLGQGNQTYRSSPVQVGALTNWSKVATGSTATIAIKTDGTIWSWGRNSEGQLGLGNTTARSSPVQIGSGTNWADAAINLHSLFVKTDGTLWSCGLNRYSAAGALGLGDSGIDRSSPTQVGSLTNWNKVATGDGSSFSIKTNGTLWAWGNNSNGQLGLGDTANRSSPVQVGSLSNWSNIVASGSFVVAVKTDKTLWAWGSGGNGRLGLGNTTSYSSPKQIGSLTNWNKIAAAYSSALATTQ